MTPQVPRHVQPTIAIRNGGRNPAEHFLSQLSGGTPAHIPFDEYERERRGLEDYPHIWMPPDALSLNKIYTIAAPAFPTTGTQVGTFTPSTNWWAVIKWVTLMQTGPNFPEGTGVMTWRILVSGNPVADFGNVMVQVGQIAGAIVPQEVSPIIVRPNSKVIVQVDNLSLNPAGINVIAVLRGWEWPSRRSRL